MRAVVSVALVVALAVVAGCCWLALVVWGVGWHGLAWVSLIEGPETLPSCLAITLAVMAPVLVAGRARSAPAAAGFVVVHTLIGWGTYQLVAPFVTGMFHPLGAMMWRSTWTMIAVGVGGGLLVAGVFGLAHWGALRMLFRATPLVVPAAAIAVALVPSGSGSLVQVLPALSGDTDLIHAVKMGYPPALTALNLGLVSVLAVLWPQRRHPPGDDPDRDYRRPSRST